MTPNEKEMLQIFDGVEVGSAWTMGKKLGYTTEYVNNLLIRLYEKGLIERHVPAEEYLKGVARRYPTYRLSYRGMFELKRTKML